MNLVSGNPIRTFQRAWRSGSRPQRVASIVGATIGIIGFAAVYLPTPYLIDRIGQFFIGVATLVWLYLDTSLRAEEQAEIEARVKQAEAAVDEHPDKARPLWDLARSRLELYFERNLSQIRSIFWITILVMAAGFTMIGYGIIRAFDSASINAPLLAAVSGILTEFIAATFLIIYRSTMSQATDYVATLERINAVGMSIQIVDSIPEASTELKNAVRAQLVSKILDTFSRVPVVEKAITRARKQKA